MTTCGFCVTGDHERCPGAIEKGSKGDLWVCPCGCTAERCVRCGDSESVGNWRCIDRDACDAAVSSRLATDPLVREIRECRARAARAPRKPTKAASPESFRPGGGKCECGCGSDTGSRFAMGHDARLRSQLAKAYRSGDREAGAELAARGGVWAKQAPDASEPEDPAGYVSERVARRLGALV